MNIRTKTLIALFPMLAALLSVSCTDKKQETKADKEAKNKVEVKLVKTVQLPEGTKDVMLDPETLEPKVLIGDTFIRFVDEDLNVKNSVVMENHERFYHRSSARGKYLGIYIGSTEYDEPRFILFDIEGKVIWERKGYTCSVSEYLAPCYVSDDGRTVAYASGITGGGIVSFHRNEWSSIHYPIDDDMTSEGKFSGNGNYFGLVISGSSPVMPFVILYDNSGNELWRRKIANEDLSDSILVSTSARYILAFSNDAYCLDRTGDVIWNLEDHYSNNNLIDGKADYISEESDLLLLRKLGLRDISMINARNGSVLWQKSTKDLIVNFEILTSEEKSHIRIKNADISKDWSLIAIATWNKDGVSPALDAFPRFLNLFDREGNLLWREGFNSNIKPFVSKDASLLAVDAKESINYYQIR